VATLIDTARAARKKAERVRLESRELRLAVRASKRDAHARTEKAAEAAAAVWTNVQRMPCGSPWSRLEWQREDEQLSRVLVPLD
jgi:hypothetical protein